MGTVSPMGEVYDKYMGYTTGGKLYLYGGGQHYSRPEKRKKEGYPTPKRIRCNTPKSDP